MLIASTMHRIARMAPGRSIDGHAAHRPVRRYLALFACTVGTALIAAAVRWRRQPSACPYSQRFWVQAPHPLITRARLRHALAPRPGERILEIGPGTGYYSLPLAQWLAPDGTLDVFDIQQKMLDHTLRRAHERGIVNIRATQGDARSLPYADGVFDAAVLVPVLGEVPDQERVLAELARVLKPGGRIVVGEIALDPHMVRAGTLQERANRVGLRLDQRLGPRLGYFARLIAPAVSPASR
jgi:SAM-dependent methyltransferase